jgi:hypothetical protein
MSLWRTAILFATAVVCGSASAAVWAQTIVHVSPKGDDNGDGSARNPLRTLPEAQRRARNAMAWDAKGVRVELAPGTYRLDEPLVFTPQDSGKSAEWPMTYAAAGEAVISGGRAIGPWRTEGKLWVADVAIATESAAGEEAITPFRDLWINGRRARRARTPNEGYFRVEAAGPDNRTSFVVPATDLQQVSEPATVEVAFLHDWSMSRIPLARIDAAARAYHFIAPIGAAQPQFAITNFEPNPRYFLEGAREFLDAPGEWFLDHSGDKIYYMPREGESPETSEAVAPQLEQLVIVCGEGDQPVTNLLFQGVAF